MFRCPTAEVGVVYGADLQMNVVVSRPISLRLVIAILFDEPPSLDEGFMFEDK